jgi:hypothetical protein
MSSESNERKPDSQEPGPPSGTTARLSARAPSAWGAARDALAAVRNLETLLRSGSVRYPVIQGLLPELKASAGALRSVFDRASATDADVTGEVGRYGVTRVTDLEALLDATGEGGAERAELATQAGGLADDLHASADLLALLERAAAPAPTTVSIQLIVRELGRPSGSGRGHYIAVRIDEGTPDFAVDADPYVIGALLSVVFSLVRTAGAEHAVLKGSEDAGAPAVVVEGVGPHESSLRVLTLQVLPAVPASAAVARHVAAQIGISLELTGTRALLRFAACTG